MKHTGHIEGGGGERPFGADSFQTTTAELAKIALLFQNSEDGFDHCFAARIIGSRGWIAHSLAMFVQSGIAALFARIHFHGLSRLGFELSRLVSDLSRLVSECAGACDRVSSRSMILAVPFPFCRGRALVLPQQSSVPQAGDFKSRDAVACQHGR